MRRPNFTNDEDDLLPKLPLLLEKLPSLRITFDIDGPEDDFDNEILSFAHGKERVSVGCEGGLLIDSGVCMMEGCDDGDSEDSEESEGLEEEREEVGKDQEDEDEGGGEARVGGVGTS